VLAPVRFIPGSEGSYHDDDKPVPPSEVLRPPGWGRAAPRTQKMLTDFSRAGFADRFRPFRPNPPRGPGAWEFQRSSGDWWCRSTSLSGGPLTASDSTVAYGRKAGLIERNPGLRAITSHGEPPFALCPLNPRKSPAAQDIYTDADGRPHIGEEKARPGAQR